jgi:purine-cytosine permease-like protein
MYVGQRSLLPQLARTRADMGEVLTILPIFLSLLGTAIWIGIYSVFPAAPVKPAIPFLWAVGGLYVAAEILMLSQALALIGMQPPIGYYISITGGMVALVLIFQHWFRKKGRIPE